MIFRKAHNTDLPKSKVIKFIHLYECIHCDKKPNRGDIIIYTTLSNGKLIWWHGKKYNEDNNPCNLNETETIQ